MLVCKVVEPRLVGPVDTSLRLTHIRYGSGTLRWEIRTEMRSPGPQGRPLSRLAEGRGDQNPDLLQLLIVLYLLNNGKMRQSNTLCHPAESRALVQNAMETYPPP